MWFYQKTFSLRDSDTIFFWNDYQFKVNGQGKCLNTSLPQDIEKKMDESSDWVKVLFKKKPRPNPEEIPKKRPFIKKRGS